MVPHDIYVFDVCGFEYSQFMKDPNFLNATRNDTQSKHKKTFWTFTAHKITATYRGRMFSTFL